MTTNTIRAFIAVELPPAAREELARVGRTLAESTTPGSVRWVRPEQMHLTMRFLADTPVAQLPAIMAVIDAAAGDVPAFALALGGLGGFPNPRRPRVIWAGLDGGEREQSLLHRLKNGLDQRLASLGYAAEDKPFHAHLTLGRVKDPTGLNQLDWAVSVAPLPVPMDALHLIESQLRPDGPIYTIRHSSGLRGAGLER